MSREIKFRAWNNHLKVMTNDVHKLDSFNEYISKENYVLMQYTGIEDKNGKEIYEEDIIRIFYSERMPLGEHKIKNHVDHFVEWNEHLCGFEITGDESEFDSDIECEIIGNLFETPYHFLTDEETKDLKEYNGSKKVDDIINKLNSRKP